VAGWDYPDWGGRVYPSPPPRAFDRLTFLAAFFDAVEINVTFYRQPDPAAARSWIDRVGSRGSFRFTAKLYQGFTHTDASSQARLGSSRGAATRPPGSITPSIGGRFDLRDEARHYRTGIEPLAKSGRLGAVLMQFPQAFHDRPASRAHLDSVVDMLDGLPLVAEFRHRSWDSPGALEFLRDRGVGFCNIDQPALGSTLPPTAHLTSSVGYIRLHGRNAAHWFSRQERSDPGEPSRRPASARYDYLYSMPELQPWVGRARTLAERAEEVFVIANNHYRGKGPANALMLKSALEGRRVPAPARLVAAFREVEACAEPVADGNEARGQGRLF